MLVVDIAHPILNAICPGQLADQSRMVMVTTVHRVMLDGQYRICRCVPGKRGDHIFNKCMDRIKVRMYMDLRIVMHLQRHEKEPPGKRGRELFLHTSFLERAIKLAPGASDPWPSL